MSHTITDPAKMRVFVAVATMATMDSVLQAQLQGMTAGFKLVSFNYLRNENNGTVTCYMVLEMP